MSLYRAIATVGGFTMLSRVFGFIRDVMIARILGAGPITDAFLVALVLPNMFRRIFGEGAFSAAFVPMFARILAEEGREAARIFAAQTLSLLLLILVLVVGCAVLVMPWLLQLIAPGFEVGQTRYTLGVEFAQITFPYLLLISLVAMLGGVLNSLDRFSAMAATPVIFNVTLICALGMAEALGQPKASAETGEMLAYAVTVSGVIQVGWMWWNTSREQFVLKPKWVSFNSRMRELGRLMLPALGAHGVIQVNLLVGTMLASTLPVGAVSYLYFADRINQLPLGVVGVAIATALLPKLTTALRTEDGAATGHLNRSLELCFLLTLPAAAALATIAEPIIVGIFQMGAFSAADAAETAAALRAFAVGLPAFVMVKVLSTAFFAREDTRTPFKIGVVAVGVNIVAAVVLMQFHGHIGLAAATSLSGWVNALLLAIVLRRRGFLPLDARLLRKLPLILLGCAGMVATLWVAHPLFAATLATLGPGLADRVLLAALVLGGATAYGLAVLGLGVARPTELRRMLRGG